MIEAAFANALTGAVTQGELRGDLNCRRWARSLTTTLIGISVLIHSRVDTDRIHDVAELAIEQLGAQRRLETDGGTQVT